MDQRSYAAWLRLGWDTWMLGVEAGTVMSLRLAQLAIGNAASGDEAELMVTEKIRAAVELQTRMMVGAFGFTPLGMMQGATRHYRRKVAANRARLTRR